MPNSDALLRVVLRSIAHELGNYLSPATMLLDGLADELDGEAAADARDIGLSVQAVLELIAVLRGLSLTLGDSSSDELCEELLRFATDIRSSFPDSEAVSSLGDKLDKALDAQRKDSTNECNPSS